MMSAPVVLVTKSMNKMSKQDCICRYVVGVNIHVLLFVFILIVICRVFERSKFMSNRIVDLF